MAKDFTSGNPMKVIFTFAIPMLLGNIFQQLYSTVDTIIVGNFEGSQAIAAVSASSSLQFFMVSLAFGFTTGMSVIISQVYGARDFEKMKRVFSTGFIFVFILACILAVTGVLISKPILTLLGTPDNILPNSVKYLSIMFMGLPFAFAYNMYSAVLRAIGDSKTPLYFLIISAITNIILDYAFVAFLHWGVAGVAFATVISQAFSGLLCHLYIKKKIEIFNLSKDEWVFDKSIIGAIVNYGLPASIQQSIISLSMMLVQSFVNFYGENMITAYGVAGKIESFVSMPLMQFAMALSMFAGQNIGAGREDRAKAGIKATMIMQLIFSFIMAFVLPIIAPTLIAFFGLGDNAEVVRIAVMGVDFLARTLFIFGLFQALNQFHRGVGDTKFSMVASLIMMGVRLPATYVFVHVLQWGEISLWLGMVTGWITALIVNTIRFVTGGWKGKAYVHERVEE